MEERRGSVKPRPAAPALYLNEEQLYSLKILRQAGWSLHFIRRHSLISPLTVLKNHSEGIFAILADDGFLIHTKDSDILLRQPG
jgi:hypothetical protein